MDYSGFASEDGIQVLLKKLKNNSKNLQILLEILEKECEILEFSKERFKKISLKTREVDEEFKSIRKVVVKMEDVYGEKVKILEQSLDALKVQVVGPLQELLIYQVQARKIHKQNLDKALKAKQQTELSFYKVKDRYFSKQKELLGLKGGYVSLNAKEALKRDQKVDKLTREVEALDVEYQHNGILVNDAWKVWEKTILATCKEGEKMDKDRINTLREKLWIYANINSESFVGQDDGCERIRAVLEACDFENDIQDFLKLNATGNQIKEPPSYVPFTIETAEEYDSIAQKAGIGKKNSLKNFFGMANLSLSSCNFTNNELVGSGYSRSGDYGNFITSDFQIPDQNPQQPKPALPTHYTLTRGKNSHSTNPHNNQNAQYGENVQSTQNAQYNSNPQNAQYNSNNSNNKDAQYGENVQSTQNAQYNSNPQNAQYNQKAQYNQSNVASEFKEGNKFEEEKVISELPTPNYNIYDFSRVKEILFHVYVLYDYQATAPEELSIRNGQLLAVFNTHEDGWWEAVGFGIDGRERVGLFPSNFCKKVELNQNPQFPVKDGNSSAHMHND